MLRALVVLLLAANLLFFAFDRGWLDGFAGVAARSEREPQRMTQQQTPDAVALLAPQGAEASFTRFLGLLADAGRLPLLAEVAGLFEQLRAEDQRVVRATVTSATALSADEVEQLRAALKRRFGREVELETAVDANLIGGAVIDAGDVVIDGSLKGKLARLQTALAG